MIANKVNVMGQEYQILKVSRDQYKTCEGLDGWCDAYGKKIYYVDPETDPDSDPIAISPEELVKQVLRHEIVHAFLTESGLAANSEVFLVHGRRMKKWLTGSHGTAKNYIKRGRRQD